MKSLYERTILITGASSGIGYVAAELFAQEGYTVYATSRHCKEEERNVGSGTIISKQMDVTDLHSIQKVVSMIEKIGIVLHCAGFGIAGASEEVPIELVEQQMNTNYLGVLRVNSLVLPKMRKCKSGLVLIVSSIGGRIALPFQSHYSSSKFALEAYAEALRTELMPFNIRVSLIEPGDTATEFTDKRQTWCNDDSPYSLECMKAVNRMIQDEQNGKSPDSVAKVLIRLTRAKRVPIRKVVGIDYKFIILLQKFAPSKWIAWLVRKYYTN